MIRTSETVWRTLSGAAVQRILVTVVSTVIVPVTQPVFLHTDGGGPAGMVVMLTSHILVLAGFLALVTGLVVLAVIDTIADTLLWDASVVITGELSAGTLGIVAVNLIRPVPAVVLVVALPGLEDASAIAAPVL